MFALWVDQWDHSEEAISWSAFTGWEGGQNLGCAVSGGEIMTVELCDTSFHCCNLPGRSNWQRNRHKHPQGVKDKNTAAHIFRKRVFILQLSLYLLLFNCSANRVSF